ncbi:hypothetical protein [Pseudoclavibacter helvolus]|uniref:hypothetical protein n=1 Tax=Pseudoclavibacter helvolus TaxID=255205 RepID=UPI0035E9FED6
MSAFKVGERVSVLRPGCVLDYSGTVAAVETRQHHLPRVTVDFSDGQRFTVLGHPDFIESMEPAIKVARRAQEPTLDGIIDAAPNADFLTKTRALWILNHSPADLT